MREQIIQIQQDLDNDQPKAAKRMARQILTPRNVSKMLSTTVDEVRALLVWALILSGDIEEARILASQIEGQKKRAGEERSRTARAAWTQIINGEIGDSNSNMMRWFDESENLWRERLERNPQDADAKEALRRVEVKHTALHAKLQVEQYTAINEESEATGGPIISS